MTTRTLAVGLLGALLSTAPLLAQTPHARCAGSRAATRRASQARRAGSGRRRADRRAARRQPAVGGLRRPPHRRRRRRGPLQPVPGQADRSGRPGIPLDQRDAGSPVARRGRQHRLSRPAILGQLRAVRSFQGLVRVQPDSLRAGLLDADPVHRSRARVATVDDALQTSIENATATLNPAVESYRRAVRTADQARHHDVGRAVRAWPEHATSTSRSHPPAARVTSPGARASAWRPRMRCRRRSSSATTRSRPTSSGPTARRCSGPATTARSSTATSSH